MAMKKAEGDVADLKVSEEKIKSWKGRGGD